MSMSLRLMEINHQIATAEPAQLINLLRMVANQLKFENKSWTNAEIAANWLDEAIQLNDAYRRVPARVKGRLENRIAIARTYLGYYADVLRVACNPFDEGNYNPIND